MADYRLYLLDAGHAVARATWLVADDDDEAAMSARAFFARGIRAIEIWRGSRRVTVLDVATTPNSSG